MVIHGHRCAVIDMDERIGADAELSGIYQCIFFRESQLIVGPPHALICGHELAGLGESHCVGLGSSYRRQNRGSGNDI